MYNVGLERPPQVMQSSRAEGGQHRTAWPVMSKVLEGSLASSHENTVGSSLYLRPLTVFILVRTVLM